MTNKYTYKDKNQRIIQKYKIQNYDEYMSQNNMRNSYTEEMRY